MLETLNAGDAVYSELKNLAVSNKTNGGVGSFTQTIVELGRHGDGGGRRCRRLRRFALANKLARIAWAVLNKEHKFECTKTNTMASRAA
jgi:hypothetical protein